MFEEPSPDSLAVQEERVLAFWREKDIFQKSIADRLKAPLFSFYDGPPFATGLPHYGHLLAGTIKDVVPRYKTMKGFYVPRRFGWDCHGLPVESEIEKQYQLSGAKSIEAFGIDKFNEACRGIVLRYTQEWRGTVERMGRWVDFNQTYRTMDPDFMESVWWAFKQVYDKGLVYEGFKVMPFSAKLGTPLSNFEAGENYKDVDDPSLTVSFPLVDEPNTSILAWTTTPWTLVSNLALMVQPEADYVKVHDHKDGRHFILGMSRVAAYFTDELNYTIVARLKGKDLVGLRYEPLFSYFTSRQDAFRVIPEESLTLDEGTGIVHAAPAFGEVDFYACKREGIELVCPVDSNGQFTAEVPEYLGLFVKDADKPIARRVKEAGRLFHQATIRHRYPFCPRSETPLIYKAVQTWFVAVEKIKDRMVEINRGIHWTPDYLKEGRFGNWLAGARDWAISRNRYWGTPIPIWRAEDGEIHVVSSRGELEELAGTKLEDLHRHFVDQLTFVKNGKTFTRIPEVFDCWFDAGSMPYAQNHYPFENKEAFDKAHPADFIAEGLDQTRGWFYTLTILSTVLFDSTAFKNVIVNGLILAESGVKMSKRLRNYPDPMEVVSKHGADAIRLYMLHSPAVRADDLCFSERGVELVLRQILIPLWNAYAFFVTYARIYDWKPTALDQRPVEEIDRWIISVLNQLIHEVELGMDNYDLSAAVEPLVGFVDQLTNWYIRRSRRRFWEADSSPECLEAFSTLYQVLLQFTKLAAPFVPFISDAIYRNLRTDEMPESVHLCDYPKYQEELRDRLLEKAMAAVQTTVSLGHSLRKEQKLKVRQPLPTAYLAAGDAEEFALLKEHAQLIADELNVKDIEFSADEQQFVQLRAKANFRTLGRKVGKRMPAVQQAIQQFTQEQLLQLRQGEPMTIEVEGESIGLTSEDIEVDRSVRQGLVAANQGTITIALDTMLSDELLMEGLAREVVNKVNTMRREASFDVADRIVLVLDTTSRVKECFATYGDYIKGEVLAVNVTFGEVQEGTTWDLNGEQAVIGIAKAEVK